MTVAIAVPVRDLRTDAMVDATAVEEAVQRVMRSGWLILGPEVSAFEDEFAAFASATHAVGVASGTDALQLALRAIGVGNGDTVVTVSHTAVATVAAIELAGANPVLVDIVPDTFTMSPTSLRDAVLHLIETEGHPPAAVVVVHLYGQPADMAKIGAICDEFGVALVEDCAQAHGARVAGRSVGSWGIAAAYSFYPTKNLGALGDAGAVTTNREDVADAVARLREYGWRTRFVSDEPGLNSRLDEIQAAVLRVRLRRVERDNDRRRDIADRYDSAIKAPTLVAPAVNRGDLHHVYHQYVVRASDRDAFRSYLAGRRIQTALHYPMPVHQQPAYRDRLTRVVPLEATDLACQQIVSLPMGPELTDAQVEMVAEALQSWHPEGS